MLELNNIYLNGAKIQVNTTRFIRCEVLVTIMNITAEIGYEYVADKNLEDLGEDVEPVDVQLKKVKLLTE